MTSNEQLALVKELSVMAELPHPKLVPLLGVYLDGPSSYLIMDLMHSDLDKILHKEQNIDGGNGGCGDSEEGSTLLPLETVLRIVGDMLEALAHLEANKVTHLDIKPQNIFSRNPELTDFLIGDFGLSKKMNSTLTRYTMGSPPGGTLSYMAPEIICENDYGLPADMYSACVVFFEVITGKRPWDGDRFEFVYSKIHSGIRLTAPPESDRCPQFLADAIHLSFSAEPTNPMTRPKPRCLLNDLYEYQKTRRNTADEASSRLDILRKELLEAQASDSRAYGAAWQKLCNDDKEAAENLLQKVQELSLKVPGAESVIRQRDGFTSGEQLVDAANVAGPTLHALGRELAEICGGRYKEGPTKGIKRIIEKTREDYGGDYGRIVDAARGSVICENCAQMALLIVNGFLKSHRDTALWVVRMKDRLSIPAIGGYRDLMFNIIVDGGHVCELQVHITSLIKIKSQAHRIYAILRAVGWEDCELPQPQGELTAAEELHDAAEVQTGDTGSVAEENQQVPVA